MSGQVLSSQLEKLLALLVRERECAKSLEMESFHAIVLEKEELLSTLQIPSELSPEESALAEQVRCENRRNAYLYWSSLKWIRETMQFFGKQVAPTSYGASGNVTCGNFGGRLLSGKV